MGRKEGTDLRSAVLKSWFGFGARGPHLPTSTHAAALPDAAALTTLWRAGARLPAAVMPERLGGNIDSPGAPSAPQALGEGSEFAELGAYQPGMDLRRLDWRAYARTNQPLARRFHAERMPTLMLVLDARSEMFFGTRGQLKIAAALSALTLLAGKAASVGLPVRLAVIGAPPSHTEAAGAGAPPARDPGTAAADPNAEPLELSPALMGAALLPRLLQLGVRLEHQAGVLAQQWAGINADVTGPPPASSRSRSGGSVEPALGPALVALAARVTGARGMARDLAWVLVTDGHDLESEADPVPWHHLHGGLGVLVHDPAELALPPLGLARFAGPGGWLHLPTGDAHWRDQDQRLRQQRWQRHQDQLRQAGLSVRTLSTTEHPWQALMQSETRVKTGTDSPASARAT